MRVTGKLEKIVLVEHDRADVEASDAGNAKGAKATAPPQIADDGHALEQRHFALAQTAVGEA
jgi:hypothetical protein